MHATALHLAASSIGRSNCGLPEMTHKVHPLLLAERPQFEWVPSLNLSHVPEATRSMQAIGNFFVDEARQSNHHFKVSCTVAAAVDDADGARTRKRKKTLSSTITRQSDARRTRFMLSQMQISGHHLRDR